jgi:hypothetical protein
MREQIIVILTGPDSTDGGKLGTKRSCAHRSKRYPLLSVTITGANTHDMKKLQHGYRSLLCRIIV